MGTYRIVDKVSGQVVCETHDRRSAVEFSRAHRDEVLVEEAAPGAPALGCGECEFVDGGRDIRGHLPVEEATL